MEFHPEMQRLMARAGAYASHFKKPVSLDLLFIVMAKMKDTAMETGSSSTRLLICETSMKRRRHPKATSSKR